MTEAIFTQHYTDFYTLCYKHPYFQKIQTIEQRYQTHHCSNFGVWNSQSYLYLIASLFYFHNSYHQINQALVSRDSYMRGIKYYHPKKERLDINTKFGWCCGGLVAAAAWCWSGLRLCFCSALVWFASAAVCPTPPTPRS